jgi:hypothetical protein
MLFYNCTASRIWILGLWSFDLIYYFLSLLEYSRALRDLSDGELIIEKLFLINSENLSCLFIIEYNVIVSGDDYAVMI